jgi:hypothetical protein
MVVVVVVAGPVTISVSTGWRRRGVSHGQYCRKQDGSLDQQCACTKEVKRYELHEASPVIAEMAASYWMDVVDG